MRILVAEKDRNGRRLLDQILKMEGHEVFTAEDGEHALNILLQFRPEVVLMNMFDSLHADGQPARHINLQGSGELPPVVFMTAGGAETLLSGFMSEKNEAHDIFDRLPTHAKICAIEHIQHLCGALSRCQKLSAQERILTQRPHLAAEATDPLAEYPALRHA